MSAKLSQTKQPTQKSNHTQGPWEVSADGIWAKSPMGARVKIATVTTFSPMNGIDSEANARVLGAAHDLLQAATLLEAAELGRQDCDECEDEGEPEACPKCFPKFDDARIMRRIAVAKAIGDTAYLSALSTPALSENDIASLCGGIKARNRLR